MKTIHRFKIQWLMPLLMALVCFHPSRSFAWDDTNTFSWLALLPPGSPLGVWNFDGTNLDSDYGFEPLAQTGVEQVPDWDGNALQVDFTDPAFLVFRLAQFAPGYGEYTNLTLGTGSIEFVFLPDWESADTNLYGFGPGDWGRLIDIGATNGDWWSLYLNPEGTAIYFSSGANGTGTNYLSATISWDSDTWHALVLTFGETNSFLYVDGELAASGDGVRYVPSGDPLTNGFAIGSDFATGLQQGRGQFDEIYTYNYQLGADEVAAHYAEIYPELPQTFHPSGGFGADSYTQDPFGDGTNGGGV